MSFLPRTKSEGPSFWKDLVLVALPAAIASIGPVVVGHWLSSREEKKPVGPAKKENNG